MNTQAKLIAYLFAKGEPASYKQLAQALNVPAAEITDAAKSASEVLASLGLALVDDGREIDLRTHAQAALLVEAIRKDEFSRDLGKAGLETLAIILYKGPSSRSEIDFIRGVNSTYTLRTLTMRGLVRRVPNPKDERSFVYEPTVELLAHLGTQSSADLPDFTDTKRRLADLEAQAAHKPAADETAL